MNRWFRLYDSLVDDPKVQLLPPEQFKILINLWCLASQNSGSLPSTESIAFKLRMKIEKVSRLLDVLRQAGLIDDDESGKSCPHNWRGRQFQSDVSTERVRRFRKHPRNVSPTVSETAPETETETETETEIETERKKDAAFAAAVTVSVTEETELFRRGKQVLGRSAGGLIKQLLAAKQGKIPLARAVIETAATKENPREYVGGALRNADFSSYVDPRL